MQAAAWPHPACQEDCEHRPQGSLGWVEAFLSNYCKQGILREAQTTHPVPPLTPWPLSSFCETRARCQATSAEGKICLNSLCSKQSKRPSMPGIPKLVPRAPWPVSCSNCTSPSPFPQGCPPEGRSTSLCAVCRQNNNIITRIIYN